MQVILIIEDDLSTRNMLSSFFKSQGLGVIAAEDGRKGLEYARHEEVDVILLDVILPYIDGFTVLSKLRKDRIQIPVIMLTDCDSTEKKVKGLEFGADDYVSKPFSTRELFARVKVQLRKSKTDHLEKKGAIQVGNVTVIPQAREVLIGDSQQVKLTKTEFDLLLCLAENKGVVVSYEELLKGVLGYHTAVVTKSIAMHIANLRRKLKGSGSSKLTLSAVTGVGYKLMVDLGNTDEKSE